jgi:hypothetical protein
MTLNATNCIIDNNTNMGSISGNFVNCIIGQDPLLGALSDNGGYTKTFALTSGSPAIDAGITSQDVPLTDQRGTSTKNAKDIGSYEYCPSTSSITNISICSSAIPYTWNGVNYTTSGAKIYTSTNSQGCDSIATLNLSINVPTSSTDSITINSSQLPYSWNGLTFNAAGTQTAHLTNAAGCDSAATLTLSVTASTVAFHLKAMLQGLYLGNGTMIAAPFSADGVSPMSLADTITVELRDTIQFNVIHTIKGLLDTAGNAIITFPGSVNGNRYYVVVDHRNSITVWSASPVTISASTTYDFTNAISKAYGDNLADDGGVFMLFSGDINQDGSIDFNDYPDLDISISETTTANIKRDISEGKLDIGILVTPLNEDLMELPLYYEELFLYSNVWEEDGSKLKSELDANKLWLLEEGHCLSNQVNSICNIKAGSHLGANLTYQTGSLETIVRLADLGFGQTIIPQMFLEYLDVKSKEKVHSLPSPIPVREVSLVHAKSYSRKAVIKALQLEILGHIPMSWKTTNNRSIIPI